MLLFDALNFSDRDHDDATQCRAVVSTLIFIYLGLILVVGVYQGRLTIMMRPSRCTTIHRGSEKSALVSTTKPSRPEYCVRAELVCLVSDIKTGRGPSRSRGQLWRPPARRLHSCRKPLAGDPLEYIYPKYHIHRSLSMNQKVISTSVHSAALQLGLSRRSIIAKFYRQF